MAEDIFKEVDDEVRAERVRALGRRFGALAAALVLAALIGAGIWQFSHYRARQQAAAASEQFFAASKLADASRNAAGGTDPKAASQASAQLARIAAAAPDGIATLARLRIAQLAWDGGQPAEALSGWDRIYRDQRADAALRGLASLLWVQHQLADGDPALLQSRLGGLAEPGSPWQAMAQELDALIDLRLGHVADAKRKLAALAENPRAPEALRSRASGLNDTIAITKTGG